MNSIVPCKPTDRVLVLIGPSGVGKSSVADRLVEAGVVYLECSHTTRPQRVNEKDTSHVFVSDVVFDNMFNRHAFLATVQPFGLPYRYGMVPLLSSPSLVTAILMRSFVTSLVLGFYPNSIIYQIEAPIELAEKRISSRGSEQGTRLKMYQHEVELGRSFATRVFVGGEKVDLYDQIVCAIKEDFSNI